LHEKSQSLNYIATLTHLNKYNFWLWTSATNTETFLSYLVLNRVYVRVLCKKL
jgi:hypothetical protein